MSAHKSRFFQHADSSVVRVSHPAYMRDYEEDPTVTEVQVVPSDAIVIRRDELPKVTTGSGRLQSGVWAEGRGWDDAYIASAGRGALATRAEAIARKYLAVAEHLREHPPVDEAQVKALLPALQSISGYDLATDEGRYYAAQDLVAERGVRVGDA